MASLPIINRLEMHVTHACNLACESCSHYSNHGHKGHLELTRADAWMTAWRSRITVGEFVLLGGEPTINPQLTQFIPLVRRHWPRAGILIVTNGFFLDRHPDLPRALADCGNARLAVSVHHDSSAYQQRIQPILALIDRWRSDHGIAVTVTQSHKFWTRRFLGFGDSMAPFEDRDPRGSWEICPARDCKQLFDGKLWKCAPIAYLNLQNQKFNLSEKWNSYTNYEPLESTCEDSELYEFITREEENICSMCSSKRREFELSDPMLSPLRRDSSIYESRTWKP